MRLISHGERPSRREEPPLSDSAWELIQSCWVTEAAKRPTIEDITERMSVAPTDMQRNSDSSPVSVLLSILRQKQPRSPVVNTKTIELTRMWLSKEDCVTVSPMLTHASDVDNLLDFMLHVLRNRCLVTSDAKMDLNRRARRLMSKIITKMPIMPKCLFLTGLSVSADRLNGVLGGSPVSLDKSRHTNLVVSRTLNLPMASVDARTEYLPTSPDVAISQSRVRTTVLGNL